MGIAIVITIVIPNIVLLMGGEGARKQVVPVLIMGIAIVIVVIVVVVVRLTDGGEGGR